MTQPELFSEVSSDSRPQRSPFPLFPGRSLRFQVAYEDLLFGALGLILILLGGFCLGVERGKGLVLRQPVLEPSEGVSSTVAHAEARSGVEFEPSAPVIPAAVSRPSQEIPPSGSAVSEGSYAIQLASYVGPQSAQEEVRRLARQGTTAQVVRQGKYYELRAVGYRSRAEAKEALADLRKTYRDAFLKRLAPSGG